MLPHHAWEQLIQKAFGSERYQENPDQVRVLAYTNRRVNQLNQKIRKSIYGNDLDRFVLGERLTANTPCLDGDAIMLQTSQECEVLDIDIGKCDRWRAWFLDIETELGDFHRLRILHESHQSKFDDELKVLAEGRQWKAFWDLKQFFHDLNYSYCLTVHKSQGSTFQDVFIDLPNLGRNIKVSERNQLYYVALLQELLNEYFYTKKRVLTSISCRTLKRTDFTGAMANLSSPCEVVIIQLH